jgi:hypothetical protein
MKGSFSIGVLLMNIAVACYLFATGILGFITRNQGEIRSTVTAIFGRGDFSNVLIVILSILAIAAGIFIILRLFGSIIPMTELILLILAIVWVVFIIMIDIIAPLKADSSFNSERFISWLIGVSTHLMVLAGIALSTNRFGGM